MVDVDKQFGGTQEPLGAHKSSPFSAGSVPSPGLCRALRRGRQGSAEPSDGRSGFLPQTGRFPGGGVGGTPPFSDWDVEGGRVCLSDLQLLKVPGPMPSPTQPLCPQTSGNNDNWSGGGELVSFLLGPRAFGKVLEAGRIDRGPVLSPALDPEKAERFL